MVADIVQALEDENEPITNEQPTAEPDPSHLNTDPPDTVAQFDAFFNATGSHKQDEDPTASWHVNYYDQMSLSNEYSGFGSGNEV